LPATMKLLGDRNWYLPRWLEWLPNFGHGTELDVVSIEPVHELVGAPDSI
jgi:RND superfamily putative drug exporter